MNHLSIATEILALLVPLSDADRTRVMRSVQAVVDMTEEYGGLRSSSEAPVKKQEGKVHVIATGTAALHPIASPAPKEKPRTAAPKATSKPRHMGPRQSADRIRWMAEVPRLLKAKGPMALREIRRELKVEKDSTLSVVMKALRDSGVVQALGENHLTRVYSLTR
jgi:hypothetical protein